VFLAVSAVGGGDDDAVAGLPAGDRLAEHDAIGAYLRGFAEPHPGAAERCAVEVHASAAADDRRTRLLVHAVEVMQSGQGGVLGADGPSRRADQQRRTRSTSRRGTDVGFAVKTVFAVALASLDTDKPDVEPGVAVGGEAQRAGDVDAADNDIGLHIVEHFVTFTDEHAVSTGRHAAL